MVHKLLQLQAQKRTKYVIIIYSHIILSVCRITTVLSVTFNTRLQLMLVFSFDARPF